MTFHETESFARMHGKGDYSKYKHGYHEEREHEVFQKPALFGKYKEVVDDLPEAVFKYRLSEAFIERHADEISWDRVSVFQKLSEDFILKHHEKLRMDYVSFYQKLTEPFIEKHHEILDWRGISAQKDLSWEFRLRHKDQIHWDRVSKFVPMTEEEARKYMDLLDIGEVFLNQVVSDEFVEEFANKIKDWRGFLDWSHAETDRQITFVEKNAWRAEK